MPLSLNAGLPSGAIVLLRRAAALFNNSIQRTALRAAADAER
jgi:hypothetical protein